MAIFINLVTTKIYCIGLCFKKQKCFSKCLQYFLDRYNVIKQDENFKIIYLYLRRSATLTFQYGSVLVVDKDKLPALRLGL